MSSDDWELFNAATDQNVHLTKTGDDAWEVGMMPNLGLLTNESARQAETFRSGDRNRLPDGREFKRVMTTAEAREAFGLAGGAVRTACVRSAACDRSSSG